MTLDELRTAYPSSPDAVERYDDASAELAWQECRTAGMGIDETIQQMKEAMRAFLPLRAQIGHPIPKANQILQQMDHPDFRRYVAAKLGMM